MKISIGFDRYLYKKILEAGGKSDCAADHRRGEDNADNGDDGALPVQLQAAQGEGVDDIHRRITSSLTMRPSEMVIMRSAMRAILWLWVTMSRVW